MKANLFGVFTACLAVICFLCALPAFAKKRYGLGIILLLNAFANLVNTMQAFYGGLF
ncbi:hypothetical protein ACMZ6Z_01965 [Streptococcus pluranimalium]|uniref:hypothetical protein n=1 Tax=Streptococcus pluranimalium TaxID=82348 RepID=UPI0039FCE3D6